MAYFDKIADVSTLKLHYFPVKTNPLTHDGVAPLLSTMLHDVQSQGFSVASVKKLLKSRFTGEVFDIGTFWIN